MTNTTRKLSDRRHPERRLDDIITDVEKRKTIHIRSTLDRRSDHYWQFSWLRTCIIYDLNT